MAVIPIIQQTWDTTSYVNPTRMNNIETNLGILSKATGIEYSSGVSVKDRLDNIISRASIGAGQDHSIPLNDGVIIFAFRAGNANVYTVDSAGVGSVGSAGILTISQSNGTVTIHNNLGVSCYIKYFYY